MSKDFKRQNRSSHKRVPSSWRKPRGIHSPRRKEEKHAAPVPKVGYRSERSTRGLHPSGYEEVLVHRPADLEELDPEVHAARVGSSVGGRKREMIRETADEMGLKLLNVPGDDGDE